MSCNKKKLGFAKTMQALSGKLIREYYDDTYVLCPVQWYIIDVDAIIEKYKSIYGHNMACKRLKK